MNPDTTLLMGILIGATLACLCFLFFRDFILTRFVENLNVTAKPVTMSPEISDAIKNDIQLDIEILKNNKHVIESILNLEAELSDSDQKTLNSILTTCNRRLEGLRRLGLDEVDILIQEEE